MVSLGVIAIISMPVSNSSGCITQGGCMEYQWGYSFEEFDHYVFTPGFTTKEGIAYDPSEQNISPDLIDRLTNEVEDCLNSSFPNHTIPSDVATKSLCPTNTLPSSINRSSFVVKVANDWVLNCDKTQQVLPNPVIAGGSGCIAKGQNDIPCPCRWRAGIKCPNQLVVTPSFYLYKDVLIRFITSCSNPWGSQEFSLCATPTTDPLSDGSKN